MLTIGNLKGTMKARLMDSCGTLQGRPDVFDMNQKTMPSSHSVQEILSRCEEWITFVHTHLHTHIHTDRDNENSQQATGACACTHMTTPTEIAKTKELTPKQTHAFMEGGTSTDACQCPC
jgi:hypothetical protein